LKDTILINWKSKVVGHLERTSFLFLNTFSFLIAQVLLVSIFDPLSVEVLQLVVFGHESREFKSECLDHAGELQYLDKAFSVLLELLWFELFVNVKVFDAVFQCLNYL
jgi:hypothetical protein